MNIQATTLAAMAEALAQASAALDAVALRDIQTAQQVGKAQGFIAHAQSLYSWDIRHQVVEITRKEAA
jgi:hypothetical protein